jgi:hypothetical protein
MAMPGQPKTESRPVRLDDELWEGLAVAAERGYGDDRSSSLRNLARWLLREPGAKLPDRPDAAEAAEIRAEAARRAVESRAARTAKRAAKKAQPEA